MSKLLHIEGVNDEVLDAAMVAGLIYLLWKSGQHVAAVAGPPGPAGPMGPTGPSGAPATVIPPPPGGHLDPIKPPRPAPAPVTHNPVTGQLPAPIAQRDYYSGGPATPPPKADPVFTKGPWRGVTVSERNAQLAQHTPAPPPPTQPEIVTTSANYSAAAHTRPKKPTTTPAKPKTTSGHVGQPPKPAVSQAKPAAHSRPVAY